MATLSTVKITPEQKQQYVKDGYFILERVIPEDHLEMLRAEAANFIDKIHEEMDKAGQDVVGINHRGKRYFIAKRYQESGRMHEFLFSDLMAEICRATLGETAYLFNEQYVLKTAEVGMKFAWHQDSGYVGFEHTPYLSCWCALDDMTEANGTVYMLPYSRAGTRTRVGHERETETNDLVGYHGNDPGEPVLCPAGSIAVFSSTCFHRSGANTTKAMRRVYLAQYSCEPIKTKESTKTGFMAPFLKDGVRVK